jgi:hypothetical protein
LIHLLRSADWLLTVEIEGWLADGYEVMRPVVDQAFECADSVVQEARVREALLRVTATVAQANLARSAPRGIDISR